MPIYEYVCQSCQKEFEVIRPMSQKDDAIVCEKCGGDEVKRKLALCYAHSGGSAAPGTSGGGGCNSCSGGDCGNCGH